MFLGVTLAPKGQFRVRFPQGTFVLAAMIECVIAAFLISDGVVTFITFQLKRKIGGNNLWDMI